MKIIDLFPLFIANSFRPKHPIWQLEFSEIELFALDEVIGENIMIKVNSQGIDVLTGQLKLLIEEIHNSKADIDDAKEIEKLDFLQFSYAIEGASLNCNHGRYGCAHDFLVWGLVDKIEYGETEEFQLGRVSKFLMSEDPFIALNALTSIFEWIKTIFNYSRHHGGLKDTCAMILDMFFNLLIKMYEKGIPTSIPEELFVEASCQVLSWTISNNHNRAEKLAKYLESNISNYQTRNQKLICIQLATGGGQFTEISKEQWALKGINNYGALLVAHEKLHLNAIYYELNLDKIEADLNLVITSIKEYNNFLSNLDPIEIKYEKTRIFGVMRGLILNCVERGLDNIATTLLCEYYSINETDRKLNNQMYIVANFNANVLFGIKGKSTRFKQESNKVFIDLIIEHNKFLSTTLVLNDVPNFPLIAPDNPGYPIKEQGVGFEEKLKAQYKFHELEQADIEKANSLIVMPGFQHPIQSMLFKHHGKTLPINVSLRTAKDDRKIKKALVWCFGTTSSDLETKMVSSILQKSGIEVEIPDLLNSSKQEFLDKYTSIEYDLIWLGTHGEYDHMYPHLSTIPILPNVEIELKEIIDLAPSLDQKRSLVLNICDGATAATYNALYDIGFGATMCGPTQSVISHIWPIEVWPALVYGLVLAHHLTQDASAFSAYQSTLNTLLRGNEDIKILLEQYNFGDDFENIWRRIPEDLNENIYHWGSSTYYN